MRKIIILLGLLSITSCSKEGDSKSSDNFNRKPILENWVNNIIIPAYSNFETKLSELVTAESTFVNTPNESSLGDLQLKLLEAQKAWQHVAMFEFGKAEELNYRLFMNTYPIDNETSVSIDDSNEDESNITDNLTGKFKVRNNDKDGNFVSYEEKDLSISSIDFSLISRADEQGFPMLDYLINGVADSNSGIVSFYKDNSNNDNHKQYLTKVINRMENLTNQVVLYWNTNASSVIANSGSSATASYDKLLNDFLNYFEQGLREPKIATPSGKRDNNPNINAVESFYSSENSKTLFLEAYIAVKNFYYGKAFNNNTTNVSNEVVSVQDYLGYLNATAYDTETRTTKNLTEFIDERWSVVDAQVETLDNDFVTQIQNDKTLLFKTFNELQKTIVLFKTNGFQSMSITVDFVDGDGD